MDAAVFGNVTLDVICQTINEVPRYDSISFDQVWVGPGGCGSNVALGLCAQHISTALIAHMGDDAAAGLLESSWGRYQLDTRYVRRITGKPTGTSIGLVDGEAQPRFIHTSGANATLTAESANIEKIASEGARALHVAGFFVLPGLLDGRLPGLLESAQQHGMWTSLDVVRSPRLQHPEPLWPCLPYLDTFLCNQNEGWRLTGEQEAQKAAGVLRARGAKAVIVKLGGKGCWLDSDEFCGQIPGEEVPVVDTTGAGDAFAAGMVAAWLMGANLVSACQAGNHAGALAVGSLGATAYLDGLWAGSNRHIA